MPLNRLTPFISKTTTIALMWFLVPFLSAQDNPILPLEPIVEDPNAMVDLIILNDETALQVIDLLEQLTGKIILRRQDIPATKINFNSRGPLSKAEAILALESLLSLNGIMLSDMGGRFLKAVPATNPSTQVPNMIIGTTLDQPGSQQIYAKLFKLEYLVADATTTALVAPLLSANNNLTLFPKSNAFLITDTLMNLQRVESILKDTDKPQEIREMIEFIKLEFIQAKDMESQLNALIEGSLTSYLKGNTKVTADERTNQLIIVTHPGNIAMLESIISNMDIDAAPLTASEVFQLKQAKAEEVVKIIDEIITGQRKSREDDAKTANLKTNTKNNNNNNPLNPRAQNAQANKAQSTGTNASLQFSEYVGLSADERTNAIVAYGTTQDLKTLKTLIDKIDIPLPQVRIEAIITEVRLGENQGTGLKNFSALFDVSAQPNLGTVLNLTNTGVGTTLKSNGEPKPLIIGNFSLTGILELAESDSDVKVLSTPSIVVSHNEEGVINVSESRPIVTGSSSSLSTSGTSTNVRSNVEFRDIGIQLEVTPLIGSDGSVQMEIQQSADQIAGETTIDGNLQPIIGKREANSTITVNDGQIAVLAGLQQNEVNDSQTSFPLIGRLPIINRILSSKTKKYNRTELIIFIRPTIVRDPGQSNKLSDDILENYEEGQTIRDYLESGTIRDIYMKGSRLSPKKKNKTTEQ
tara:strand:+ start:18 stop:2105 length:2088 start_codon:yes stop_codon:yes gene_type:complete